MLAQNLANNLGHGLPAVQPGTRPALGGRAAQRAAHGEALPKRDSAHPGPRGLRAKRARPRARTGTRRWRPSSAQSPLAARPIRPRRRPAGAGGRVNVSPAHPCGAVGWFCGCHALPRHARALPVPVACRQCRPVLACAAHRQSSTSGSGGTLLAMSQPRSLRARVRRYGQGYAQAHAVTLDMGWCRSHGCFKFTLTLMPLSERTMPAT